MSWLSIIFGKSTARSIRKGKRLANAVISKPAPIRSSSPKPAKVKWAKTENGNDQAELEGFRVTIFKRADLWNYCVVEILDDEDVIEGMEEDPIFGDGYASKSEARREAFVEIGYE